MATKIDIGVFAHNEAAGIAAVVAALAQQDIHHAIGLDTRIVILANGCRDDTVARARAVDALGLEVVDLPLGGKSRTWNRFVHDLSRRDADILVFCDADIGLPAPDSLRRLCAGLVARPNLWVLNSQPVKDISHHAQGLSVLDKMIASAGGGLDDWKTSICGQLYAMPTPRARVFHLPIGLPVEDGFLRAMVLTDALVNAEDFSRIDGLDGLFHLYASERSIAALIRHQERIVIGSAINAACFATLRDLPADQRAGELARAAADETWLGRTIKQQLPQLPFAYVPAHFWGKRLVRFAQTPKDFLRPKRVLITVLGFGFDTIVYAKAQYRMFKGTGAGFW